MAVVDDADAVAELLGLLHVVRGVDDCEARRPKIPDALQDGVPTLRVNADGRLVEDEKAGSVEQAGADVEPSLHARH